MNLARTCIRPSRPRRAPGIPLLPGALMSAVLLALSPGAARAFEVDTGHPDLKVLWDTTLKYSTGFRVKGPSSSVVGGSNYDTTSSSYFPNTDDGSRNFRRGLVSNRLDLLSELDVSYQGFGARISGAGWYDRVYQRGRNDNDSASTANATSVEHDQFTEATRKLHGGSADLLDAFVFGKFQLGSTNASVRLGKHTLLYGESLMLGANGIAAAQASIDVVKAATVPNAQFKEFMMPINQLSAQLQVSEDVTVGGYYMLDWKSDRLPGSGSYYSFMDSLATGGERLIVGHSPAGNVGFAREADMKARRSGQGGVQVRFHVEDVDYGLYAVQWHDHGPSGLYLHPSATPVASSSGLQVGTYQWAFHEGIRAVGGSFSTTLGNVNLSGEVSMRSNTPLDSDAQVDVAGADNSGNPLYAVGKSAHAQVNWIASIGPTFLAREADFVGEVAWNRRLSISKNAAALNPNASRDAANLRVVFEPKYRQVLPGLDLSVPVGVGYGLWGNSSTVGAFMGAGTGDVSIGVNGAYLDVWRFGLNLTHYMGPAGPFIENGHRSFKQYYADRDYLSFNLRRTF
ncbi:uncharacterized protein DUF1302 [Sphaerotilus hippei]|uniref:Uncharacterized protein DUF1302 n=1 Tax=Sphaerotilus hippei TaxID=744406 RepID=A0A318H2D4_9BURK|nr:DUF1302 domain-containing protein [Sphaerotilus hippei]PXW97518.1 uncharacterized protein DUF1302 [Sphaerotilus hippei]